MNMINKIYIVCKNPKESIDVRQFMLKDGGFSEDKYLKFFLDNKSEKYFINPRIIGVEIVNGEYRYKSEDIHFLNAQFHFEEKLKELKNENTALVSYETFEKTNFSKDFQIFNKDYIKETQKKYINDYIIWQLESGITNVESPLKNRDDSFLLFNDNKVNVKDFIKLTDNIELLKYCLNNEKILSQFGSDPLNIQYDKEKQPNCFEYIEKQREIVKKINEYEFGDL